MKHRPLLPAVQRSLGAHARRLLTASLLSSLLCHVSVAADPQPAKSVPSIQAVQDFTGLMLGIDAYEPNQLGVTKDKDNDAFMDFTVSLMIQVLPAKPKRTVDGFPLPGTSHWAWQPFGAVTLRGGQHIISRASSPVVGKRFNPILPGVRLVRQVNELYEAIDVVYAHESNGQSIAHPDRLEEIRQTYLKIEDNDAGKAGRIARDNLSRGWDYFGARYYRHGRNYAFTTALKVFLTKGIFQRGKEEFKSWENDPEGKTRQTVDGFSATFTRPGKAWPASLTWTTGLNRPASYHTWKFEFGRRFRGKIDSRVFIWARHGYNSDLVNYYRKNTGGGLAISFWDPSLPHVPARAQ